MNVENLTKLRDALLAELPKGVMFDMLSFMSHDKSEWRDSQESIARRIHEGTLNICGTAACAAGLASIVIAPLNLGENFTGYCARVFGVETEFDDNLFEWMFGSQWRYTDNTPRGAAARIQWILDGKDIPDEDGIERMQRGEVPLCYTIPGAPHAG